MFSAGTRPVRVSLPCSAAIFVPSALAPGNPCTYPRSVVPNAGRARRWRGSTDSPRCPSGAPPDKPARELPRYGGAPVPGCQGTLGTLEVHPRVAMQILRHSRIAVTMEIYTEVSSAATREALRKLGHWLDV